MVVGKHQQQAILSELTQEHYELMHKTKEYWINRALRGGSNFTLEDIRPDINWIFKHVGDMKTDKPYIFLFDSYATYQLGYNLLRLATEDVKGTLNTEKKNNILYNAAMDRVWDLVWFGEHGQSIHESLDARVRRDIQEKIWEGTARNTGDSVGMGGWDIIRQTLNNSVSEIMWTNLWKMIAIPGAKSIRSKVTEQVWNQALEQLAQYVGNEVGENVTRKIEASLETLIANSDKKLQFVDHFIGMGNWAGWMSFYDFFVQSGIISEGNGLPQEWAMFRRLLDRGIWTMAFYDDCALVCKLPTRIRRDEVQKQLHALNGPAVEWPDGTGQYFIYGINFSETFADHLGTPPALWNKLTSGEITWTEIFTIRNIEQRRVAIRVYGPEKILKDAKAKLIDKSARGNELYQITPKIATRDTKTGKVTFREDDRRTNSDDTRTLIPEMRVMHYQDPSTDRWYYSFVPNNINKADAGMSWKLQLSEADYAQLKVEA